MVESKLQADRARPHTKIRSNYCSSALFRATRSLAHTNFFDISAKGTLFLPVDLDVTVALFVLLPPPKVSNEQIRRYTPSQYYLGRPEAAITPDLVAQELRAGAQGISDQFPQVRTLDVYTLFAVSEGKTSAGGSISFPLKPPVPDENDISGGQSHAPRATQRVVPAPSIYISHSVILCLLVHLIRLTTGIPAVASQ